MTQKVRMSLVLLVTIIAFSSFSGCAKKEGEDPSNDDGKQTQATDNQRNKKGEKEEDEPITFTYWVPVHTSSVKVIKDFSENEAYKEVMKQTYINLKFIHPALGQEKDQFQLLFVSHDLPDLIQHNGQTYPGGPDKAIEEGVYLKLNDLIDKHAPNYKKLRESDDEVRKLTATDEGNIWAFMKINGVQETAWRGPIVRKDLLDKAGLPIPVTIDDWYATLKAFKDMGLKAPLLFPKSGKTPESQFTSAFGIANEFYQEDGVVKYGPIEPGYKDYLATISKWYKEGLIDKDFPTRDQDANDSLVVANDTGAWIGAPDTGINPYMLLKKDEDPEFVLAGAPYPVLKEGGQLKIGQKIWAAGGSEVAVTKACKYPEKAVEFMDFGYSEEGSRIFNYGIEGVSYEMKDGEPVFTDLMTNNPDNIDFYTLAWKYKLHEGPYLRDWTAIPPLSETEKQAREAWKPTGTENNYPKVSHTSEETKELSSIQSDLDTYKDEMIMNFILGEEPLSNYDDFVEQLKSLGVERMIAIKQDALDRYNAK